MEKSFAEQLLQMYEDTEERFHFAVRIKTGDLYWSSVGRALLGTTNGTKADAGTFFQTRLRAGEYVSALEIGRKELESTGCMRDILCRIQKEDGTQISMMMDCETVTDPETGEAYYIGSLSRSDGTAEVNDVTGLYSQEKFRRDLRLRKKNGIRAGYLILGVQRFPEINSLYGYEFGTRLLQQIGLLLLDFTAERNLFLYHTGGVRFVLAFQQTVTKQHLRMAYEELRQRFRNGIAAEGITVSLEIGGGALIPTDEMDENEIAYELKRTLDESKRQGSGGLRIAGQEDVEKSRARLQLAKDLRRSILNDCSGFYIVFQPIVDAKTDRVTAAEALTRWNREPYGNVPPGVFIPLLENDPIFLELGQWILKTSLREANDMNRQYPGIVINVNLSYMQLVQENFANTLYSVVEESGFPADQICLELTERCRILDMDFLRKILTDFRSHGMKIAIDDFGTGFSSLAVLREVPVDTIKIDRSFILNIEESRADQEMIRSIVSLASGYGKKVCVEGVETENVRDVLVSLKADEFQGYYFGKPKRVQEIVGEAE